jgi:hypothetical protein
MFVVRYRAFVDLARTTVRVVMVLAVVVLVALIFTVAATGRGTTALLADVILIIWLGWVNTLIPKGSE